MAPHSFSKTGHLNKKKVGVLASAYHQDPFLDSFSMYHLKTKSGNREE